MFEESEQIAEMVEGVYSLLTELQRGEVLLHEPIEDVVGCARNTEHYQHVVDRARDRLQEKDGIATWPEKPIGYKLLTTHEQLWDLPNWRRRKARSQYRRARKSIVALPTKGLSLHDRRVRLAEIDKLALAKREVDREIRSHNPTTLAYQPSPRIPKPVA